MTRILTADFGTTATKAALWDERGLVAVGSAPVPTNHPQPGWAEQVPDDWWRSFREAVSQLPDPAPLDAIGLCGARETYVAVDTGLVPVGPGVLWSDRRAAAEAMTIAEAHGGSDAVHQRTGLVLDAGLMVSKVAWTAAHRPQELAAARWLLAPRDWIAGLLTGTVATDPTMASRTGFVAVTGEVAAELAVLAGHRLAPIAPSDSVIGQLLDAPARELGLPAGTPVVAGAGDRACEVLGAAASATSPTVSWGTTANVSVPVAVPPAPVPAGVVVSRAAPTQRARPLWILEAGLSASGAAIAWLAGVCGMTPEELYAGAATSAPGARGVIALPWLNGSRAPWWQPGARAAFAGLTAAHGRDDLARAIIEGVAFDVDRSLTAVAPASTTVQATGGGSAGQLWRSVLAAVTQRPVVVRAVPDTASVGACVLAAAAINAPVAIDAINPVITEEQPDPALVAAYRRLRDRADQVASTIVALGFEG